MRHIYKPCLSIQKWYFVNEPKELAYSIDEPIIRVIVTEAGVHKYLSQKCLCWAHDGKIYVFNDWLDVVDISETEKTKLILTYS